MFYRITFITDGVTECSPGCKVCEETTKSGTTERKKTRCIECRRGWKLLNIERTCESKREHYEYFNIYTWRIFERYGARLNSLYVFNSLICTIVCMLFFAAFMLCCFVRI